MGDRTQEEVLKFYGAVERGGIKDRITERTGREISLPTLMHVLMVGKKVPWEKDALYVIGMGAAYERSKAKILRWVYDTLQEKKDRRLHTAIHFEWVIRNNWEGIKSDGTVKDTYGNGNKIPKEPWSPSYCRLIHAAIKTEREYAKSLEERR